MCILRYSASLPGGQGTSFEEVRHRTRMVLRPVLRVGRYVKNFHSNSKFHFTCRGLSLVKYVGIIIRRSVEGCWGKLCGCALPNPLIGPRGVRNCQKCLWSQGEQGVQSPLGSFQRVLFKDPFLKPLGLICRVERSHCLSYCACGVRSLVPFWKFWYSYPNLLVNSFETGNYSTWLPWGFMPI